jgi:hypothetical protein
MSDKVKALYVGFNRSYTNPTFEIQIRIFSSITDLSFYGPGFSSDQDLQMGIEKFASKYNYELLIVDTYVFEFDYVQNRTKPFGGDFIRFTKDQYYLFARSYNNFFREFQKAKILIANWDTFNIGLEMIERLINSNAFVLDPGISSSSPIKVLEELYGTPVQGTDNWHNFVTSYSERILSIPHTISMDEIDFSPLSNRKHLFSVIGAPYPERKQAYSLMKRYQKNDAYLLKIRYGLLFRLSDTLSFNNLTNIRNRYFSTCSNSKFCYVSGGPWMYPVRKYFEIPARGSVAIGWPCVGFKNYGFVDKKNFLVAKTNKEVKKIIQEYSISEIQSIAEKGRQLMIDFHSNIARAEQISSSLNLILSNNFKGSTWQDGKYFNIT